MLKKLRQRWTESIDDIEDRRLQHRIGDLGTVPIADAPCRVPVLLAGEVQGVQVVPRAGSPSLEVSVSDGTGRATAVFTGRRRLGGVHPGRRLVLEGVGREERGRIVLLNPAYTIVE